ncbi:tRNA (cytidine(34)-2'-O)-methyltransferase, partial [Rhizobium ruizarguesonis]
MTSLRLALYQPDIPCNTGTILRLAACLVFAVDLIEPAGFDISDRNLKRAGMDYIASAALRRHASKRSQLTWRVRA